MVSLELASCEVNVGWPITRRAACPVVKPGAGTCASAALAIRRQTEKDFMREIRGDLPVRIMTPNYSKRFRVPRRESGATPVCGIGTEKVRVNAASTGAF